MEAVRALLPRFEAKIQRVLDRVWGTASSASQSKREFPLIPNKEPGPENASFQ